MGIVTSQPSRQRWQQIYQQMVWASGVRAPRSSSTGSDTSVTCRHRLANVKMMMMRFRQDRIVLIVTLSVLGTVLPAGAQNREPTSASYASPTNSSNQALRLLSADEGLAVLGAALESRTHSYSEADCSHLVHAVYKRAGFPYSYASSSSLYAGTGEFRRVTRPQPGDLVVWPGHAGIVVNPAQHTFFSALRSGHGVEPYDSAYWRQRGHPRFLRYVMDAPATIPASPSSRGAGVQTAVSTDQHPANGLNATRDASEEPQTQPSPPVTPVALIHSPRPTSGEVTAALERILNESGDGLRDIDMLNPVKPLVVFDQISVDRVRLQRDHGWAEVHLAGALKLSKQKTNSTKHNESQRWQLVRHDHDSWEITLSSDATYVPSEIAVRALAHQLSALTDEGAASPETAEEKLQLSRLLSLSLQKPATKY